MAIRAYDPSKVKREHIRPKTLVYGTDKPGIELRMRRFEEVLAQSGESPSVFPDAKSAIGYLSSGDMFSDTVTIVIYDVADMLKSDTTSKQTLSAFLRALATYGDDSTIVIGASAKGSSMSKLASEIEAMGGIAREVEAPRSNDFTVWLSEYAKSADVSLSVDALAKVAQASGEDTDAAVTIMDVMGAEIESLSADDIRSWLDANEEVTGSDIRALMESRDIAGLLRLREMFPANAQGYRTYLVRLRHNLIDILIASTSKGDIDPLFSFKASQYGNGNSAYYVMREPVGDAHTPYYASLYAEVNRQIESMAKSGQGDMRSLLATVASAGR